MVTYCSVCKKDYASAKNIRFHNFPTKSELKKVWLQILGIDEQKNVTNWRVCSNHFTKNDYHPAIVSGKPILNKNATPSINLPQKPIKVEQNVTEVFCENSYEIKNEFDETICHNSNEIFVKAEPLDILQDESEQNDASCADNFEKDSYDHLHGHVVEEVETPSARPGLKRKRRCSSDNIWSDFENEEFLNYRRINDVDWDQMKYNPKMNTICWQVAVETIEELEQKLKESQAKVKALESKVENLQELLQ